MLRWFIQWLTGEMVFVTVVYISVRMNGRPFDHTVVETDERVRCYVRGIRGVSGERLRLPAADLRRF